MGWNPPDSDLVVPRHHSVAALDGRYAEALTRSDGVGPDPVDCGGGVYEDRILVSPFLPLVDHFDSLCDGIDLRVEHLLVVAKMKAAALLPLW